MARLQRWRCIRGAVTAARTLASVETTRRAPLVELPVTDSPSLYRIRVMDVGEQRRPVNLMRRAASPQLLFIGLRNGGPPAVLGRASPIRTQVKGPVCHWANWRRSILTSGGKPAVSQGASTPGAPPPMGSSHRPQREVL
jgi:hypothetical protein